MAEQAFDTHCHLDFPDFDPDREEVIARARAAGIGMLTVGTSLASSHRAIEIAERHEGIYASVGIHPNDTGRASEQDLEALRDLAERHDVVIAVGETGLDFSRDDAPPSTQEHFFRLHLELATSLGLPVLLHARKSAPQVLHTIESFIAAGGKAIWHCFTANKKVLRQYLEHALELGLYFGISGMVTFEDQGPLREIIPRIPDRYLLLDTDAPFLRPRDIREKPFDRVPSSQESEYKGSSARRNEPTACLRIAEELASLRQVSVRDILRITLRNARTCLNLSIPERTSESAIVYAIRNSLYISLTHQCTNDCVFCARHQGYLVKGHDIRLDHEPSAEEVLAALQRYGDLRVYDEVVFCGFGEPTMRLDVLKFVAEALHAQGIPVRLNTNGLANLFYERDILPELVGRVDTISISLNSADPAQYASLCRSRFGDRAHPALCEFIRRSVQLGFRTICTVVALPEVDVEAARHLAETLGASFRVRSHVDVG